MHVEKETHMVSESDLKNKNCSLVKEKVNSLTVGGNPIPLGISSSLK